MCENSNFFTQNFWTNNCSGINIGLDQKSFWPEIFWDPNYLNLRYSWTQHFLDPTIVRTKHFFGLNIFWNPISFWTKYFFGPKILFGPVILLIPKCLDQKMCGYQNSFQPKHIYYSKYFWTIIVSIQIYFNPKSSRLRFFLDLNHLENY